VLLWLSVLAWGCPCWRIWVVIEWEMRVRGRYICWLRGMCLCMELVFSIGSVCAFFPCGVLKGRVFVPLSRELRARGLYYPVPIVCVI
jgi:hypothetical protein